MGLDEKYNSLKNNISELGKVIVAYSGGVDSTFLLKVAVDVLGKENVLACIGISASLADAQHQQAIECARQIDANLEEVKVDEVSDQNYSANKADRCFHCKSHLFGLLTQIAKERDYPKVLCGSNFDDKDDYRPGNRAANVFGVLCPMMDAQLTKNDIRQLSRNLNLPTADLPASPCLASRISYGLEITEQKLKQVEQAEDFLRQLGFSEFRVRHHNELARIELKSEDIEKIAAEPVRKRIVEKLKSLGFKFISLDLEGFRSGAMNVMLSEKEKQQNI